MTAAAWRSGAISLYHEGSRRLALARTRKAESFVDRVGVAVVTSAGRANGLSRGAELQRAALRAVGVACRTIDVTTGPRRLAGHVPHRPASTYVFHAAAPETSLLLNQVLPEAGGVDRIGYWAWELPDPPANWRRYEALVSEVWTPSTFAARSLSRIFSVPVRVVPHRVAAQPRRRRIPGTPFTVVTMADGRSSFSRKNPVGAVAAFRAAFGNSMDARLVVKLSGRPEDIAQVMAEIRPSTNVEFRTTALTDEGMTELYRSADVLLSLHRAEGFGLPMLEAMSHGVPVVGTGWSGNLDFMSDANAALVPYTLVPVHDRDGVYGNRSDWAEPDVAAAAELLRDLADDESAHDDLARAAHASVAELPPALPSGWSPGMSWDGLARDGGIA